MLQSWDRAMVKRYSSTGLFGVFGRSGDLRQFDDALRALDVHPRIVPEAVKLTVVKLLKEQAANEEPVPRAYREAAELIGYCRIGAESFAGANDVALAEGVERRIEQALEAGDSLDAKLVLLMLHAKAIQPSVVDRFDLESGE